jgi:hypothetical protein
MTEEIEPQVPQSPSSPATEHVDKGVRGSGFLLHANLEPNNVTPDNISPFIVNQAAPVASDVATTNTEPPSARE